jgi:hypothetical protein
VVTAPQTHARQQIETLITRYRALDEATRKTTSEASVVNQFITPLLEALGWPVHDPARFKYELNTQVGRPDMTLLPDQGGAIFVEAKRFGVIQQLAQARTTLTGVVTPGQMALPGMAADRTREEQQAINYAFQNGGTWAILTNFERLRLFNARRDWLVLSFEHPSAYRDQFDLLWQLSYEAVLSGELDRLNSQRHREDVDTAYLAFINEWRERLAQDILSQPAANPWAFRADGRIDVAILREVVQRILDRLVVIRFAEDHLVIPPNALQSIHDLRQANPYTFPLNQSYAQMFRVFDARHNSGLFAPSLADQAVLSDAVLAGLTRKLYEARYRAFTADIMGNTYEQYLGKTLAQRGATVETVDNLETRKKQGSYYTGQVIVRYLVDHSLGRTLYGTENGRPDGQLLPGERRKTAAEIRSLRLLDMACGSGGFLLYAYELLAEFYRLEIARLEHERRDRLHALMQQGVTTPFDLELQLAPWQAELDRIGAFPTFILENHLYGVDLDPQAAELATVNLLMRAMADMRASEDQQQRAARLPLILNQNVKVGNSLIGATPDDPRLAGHAAALAELRRLRLVLAAEAKNDPHDPALARIGELTSQVTAALNTGLAAWFADPAAQRPFYWPVEFPEVFLDEAGLFLAGGGFTITVGNPPWEIVKPELREYYAQFDAAIESKYTREQVERRIAELDADPVIAAGWAATKARIEAQAAYYRGAGAFTRQGRGDTATHKLFVERAYALLQDRGRLAYVIPSGIYTDLGTKALREMLFNEGRIEYLYNFSNERFFFPAVDHRVKFTLLGAQNVETSDGFWASFRFNPRVAVRPEELADFLARPANLVYIRLESLVRFSPDSLSVMEFQSQRDYDIAEKIYGDHPLLGHATSYWNVKLNNEFHFTNDRHLLNQVGRGYPLVEGKTIHQFDANYSTYNFWVDVDRAGLSDAARLQLDTFRVVHRRIAGATNERTLLAAIIPPGTAAEVNATVALIEKSDNQRPELFVCSILNSFVSDYVIRYKVSTTLNMFYMYQLPVPRLTTGNPYFDAIVPRAARLTCTTPAFADLWQQVMGEPWTPDAGARDPAERQRLRDEIDALVAHLYGLSRDEFAHILGAFPLVFADTPAGRQKKAALLAVYERTAGREIK